jgi:putative transposase
MPCPHCQSSITRERATRSQLGYRTFRCSSCKRSFNERSGTPFNYLIFPSDIVLQVVLWRLRYKVVGKSLLLMAQNVRACVSRERHAGGRYGRAAV